MNLLLVAVVATCLGLAVLTRMVGLALRDLDDRLRKLEDHK